MPKRKVTKKYPTPELQGEGSWVVFRYLKVSDIQKIKEEAKAEGEDYNYFDGGLQMLEKRLVRWNWVGDEGEPLPQPTEDPSIIGELNELEIEGLTDILLSTTESKN